MDAIREQFEKPLVAGIVGLVVGLFIGLVILGWWLSPVQWTNASPADLRADSQVDYTRMTIDSYTLNQNADLAQQRYNDLGEAGSETLQQIQNDPAEQRPEDIQTFSGVVQADMTGEVPAEEEGGSNLTLLLVMCLVTVIPT